MNRGVLEIAINNVVANKILLKIRYKRNMLVIFWSHTHDHRWIFDGVLEEDVKKMSLNSVFFFFVNS